MIYFIRHGESEANVAGVFAGQKDDTPLTTLGREQAQQAAQQVIDQGIKVEKIISSKLLRAKQTAEIVSKAIGYDSNKIEYDDRIIEYDMGALSGTPIRKVSSLELTNAKDAEDADKFQERVQSFLDQYRQSKDAILVISHAGVGRMVHATDRGLPANEFYSVDPFPNASVNKIS